MMAPALAHAQPCAGELDQFELEDGPFVTRTFFKRVRVIDGTAWAVGYQQTIDELLNIVMRLEGDEWVEVQSPSPENVLGQAENTLFDLDGRSGGDRSGGDRARARGQGTSSLGAVSYPRVVEDHARGGGGVRG